MKYNETSFKKQDAIDYGLRPAIILNEIREKKIIKTTDLIVKFQYMTKKTIYNCLERLIASKKIEKAGFGKWKIIDSLVNHNKTPKTN